MRKIHLAEDSPVLDMKNPVSSVRLSCLSEGEALGGVIYYAEGLFNPTIVFCHGFPGAEKNLDIAQTLRQAGLNTIVFSYRGAWGSKGSFSFSGVGEDVRSVVHAVSEKTLPNPDRFDPNRIIILGHSMGCFAALRAVEMLPGIQDIVLIAPWNIGADAERSASDAETRKRLKLILASSECLVGTTPDALFDEIMRNTEDFDLRRKASNFVLRNILSIGASEDILTPNEFHHGPLTRALRQTGARVSESVLCCDHVFSAKRHALSRLILDWLAGIGY